MRDTALIAAAAVLAGLSVLVDFTSALLSVASDAALVGAGAFALAAVLKHKNGQVRALRDECAALRLQLTARP